AEAVADQDGGQVMQPAQVVGCDQRVPHAADLLAASAADPLAAGRMMQAVGCGGASQSGACAAVVPAAWMPAGITDPSRACPYPCRTHQETLHEPATGLQDRFARGVRGDDPH